MPRPKPPYPAAFRQQMVELVRAGRGITDLAREFGCNASSIHAWVKAAGRFDGSGITSGDAPLSVNERQELIDLRRKFKQVQASSAGARHIGKGYGLVCRQKREDVHVVCELVKANQAELPVRALCKTLRLSHSGYYDWLERPACAQAQANAVLLEQIRQAHEASDATYGVLRIQVELAYQGN